MAHPLCGGIISPIASATAWLPEDILEDARSRSQSEATLRRRSENYYRLLRQAPAWSEQILQDLGFDGDEKFLLYFETPDERRYFPPFQFGFFPESKCAQWPIVTRINQEWRAAGISLDLLLTWWLDPHLDSHSPALNLGLMPDDELYAHAETALRSL